MLVKGNMFGIAPDRHTWMLELSYEPFVNGSRSMSNILPLLDLSGTISDLIPKKDILGRPCTEGKIWATAREVIRYVSSIFLLEDFRDEAM